MENIVVFTVIVVIVLIIACWIINLACGALHAPPPLATVLQILAALAALVAICRRVGWF